MNASDQDDVIARAARSLRAEQDAVMGGGAAASAIFDPTWSRIAGDVRRGRERRRLMVVVGVQLAIGLAAMGVGAAVLGRFAPAAKPPAAAPAEPGREAPPPRHRSRGPAAQVLAPALTAPEPTAPGTDPAPPVVAPRSAAALRPRRANGALAIAAAPGPREQSERVAEGLYRDAHHLHFVRRDFAAALAAWDRYLAGPGGALAIEARYNRAIALVHLGRGEEAAAALRPFADGELGSYRQEEARALIEKLRQD